MVPEYSEDRAHGSAVRRWGVKKYKEIKITPMYSPGKLKNGAVMN